MNRNGTGVTAGRKGVLTVTTRVYGVVKLWSGAFKSAAVRTKILIPEAGHLKVPLAEWGQAGRVARWMAFFSGVFTHLCWRTV